MTRRSRWLWTAAVLWSAAPAVCLWILDLLAWIQELLAPPEEYGDSGAIYGMVRPFSDGRTLKITVWLHKYIHGTPAFALDAAPYVLLGLGTCLLAARRGRPEAGRVVVRLLAVVLVLVYGVRPLLFLMDAADGSMLMWGSSLLIGDLCQLVAVLMMVLALRAGRRAVRRRGRVARVALAVPILLVAVLLPGGDTPPGKVTFPDCPYDLQDLLPESVTGWDRFMCEAHHTPREGKPALTMPDRELVANTRYLCEVATRHGGDVDAPGVRAVVRDGTEPILWILEHVCPAVRVVAQARRTEAQVGYEQMKRDAERYLAEQRAACAALPRHRPKIKPVRRGTMYVGGEHGFEAYEGETGSGDWERASDTAWAQAWKNHVVGTADGLVIVRYMSELGQACLTTESYTRRPPVETEGWDRVVEVGYRSPTGGLYFGDLEEALLPDLISGGPGDYRVRVHIRGKAAAEDYEEPYTLEETLIMVYPGAGRETIVHRMS